MELRDYALRIVETNDLTTKLERPPSPLTDERPGPALRIDEPGRPRELRIVPAERARVPSLRAMPDPAQRARIVHALANHELQAVELFAWAILAFPEAPAEYRRGLRAILTDEQRHTRMYAACLLNYGARFGDFPVSGYFWSKVPDLTTPLRFACAMGLTFENANLDHTEIQAREARRVGDEELASVIEVVHRDEIRHVRFGWTWLARLKEPSQTMWEAYRANVTWPLRPELARGREFYAEPRLAAGMDEAFVEALATHDEEPRPGAHIDKGRVV